jgi:hypothetical protein
VGHFVIEAGLCDRRGRVAPPDDRHTAALRALDQRLGDADVPWAKFSSSKTPSGPFQTTVLASRIVFEKSSIVAGPTSRQSRSAGILSAATTFRSASLSNLSAATPVHGQEQFSPAPFFRRLENFRSDGDFVRLDERLPHFAAHGAEESVGHAAADDERVDFAEERLDDVDFSPRFWRPR